MEAVPRLPMISFELKSATEPVNFGPKIKQYIASFYHEDAESYSNEINNLESLRAAAVRPSVDVMGCQTLKKYYCQLHFLKSRFPMEEGQPAAVYFSWRDSYTNMSYSVPDIEFELMNILYNIGALHSKLGAEDNRTSPEGMKMACTHFQCAAWAFQNVRESYPQTVNLVLAPEVLQYMHLVCLAQSQECILEKSMLDNRKATIIAKVAVQVVDYYKQSLKVLQAGGEEGSFSDLVGSRTYKEWVKYLSFKVSYHNAIALLYQGQQAEEQQKMGERVAFYQAASEMLHEARKKSSHLAHQQEINEALAFTNDVIEGKCKAAKNENEFIYHEEIPNKDALQEVKGASLVKGIPFNINDVEVSGPDIFSRLVPIETHEASSLYSEQKAQFLRQMGANLESKDRALAEFMSSLQTDVITQVHQANGLPQQIIDRAAAMSAKPTAIQDLIDAMGKLSNSYQEVEAMLKEIDAVLKEEEQKEQEYQSQMGARPPSIITTDLKREAAKYQEAHSKASESNQNLHRAMTSHIANLKILSQPLNQLQQQIPSITLPNSEIDEESLREMETLLGKVEEMKHQRVMLWHQLREAVQNDDITSVLITKSSEQPLDVIFQNELEKHKKQASILEQNMSAQDNICKALVDAYARFTKTRRYLNDVMNLRTTTISSLINSYDTYDDLLSKANKGIEFYGKLETNVTKLLQRIKSTCKVQDEEREQMLSKSAKKSVAAEYKAEQTSSAPKLKDYLNSIKTSGHTVPPTGMISVNAQNTVDNPMWPPSIRPAPVGSEMTTDQQLHATNEPVANYSQLPDTVDIDQSLAERMASLKTGTSNQKQQIFDGYGSYATPLQTLQTPYTGQEQYPLNASVNYSYSSSYLQQPLNYQTTQYSHANTPYTQGTPQSNLQNTYSSQVAQYSTPASQVQTSLQYGQPPASGLPSSYSSPIQTSQYVPQPSTGVSSYSSQNTQQPTSLQGAYSPYTQEPSTSKASQSFNPSAYSAQTGGNLQYYQTSQASYPSTYPQYQPQASYSYDAVNVQQPSMVSGQYSYYPQQDGSSAAQVIQNLPTENNSATAVTNTTYTTLSNTIPNVGGQDYDKSAGMDSYQYGTSNYTTYTPLSMAFMSGTATSSTPFVSNAATGYMNASSVVGNTDGSGNYNYGSTTSGNVYSYPTSSSYPITVPSSSENYAVSTVEKQPTTVPQDAYQNQSAYCYQGNYNYYQTYDGQSNYYANQPANYTGTESQSYCPVVSPQINYQILPSKNQTLPTSSQNSPQINYQILPSKKQTLPTSSQNSTTVNVQGVTETKKNESSNIDLLSGLDFSINHPPLQPQKTEGKDFSIEVKPKPVDQVQQTIVGTSKSEEKGKTVKVESAQQQVKLFKRLHRRLFENETDGKQFLQELEKVEKFIEVLCNKTLSGPTTLDMKWKEIQDKQEMEQQKQIISVARCYPSKNRFPDILPYDHTRVELISTKDDYINASILKDITPNSPTYLVTQAPLPSTIGDFWTMVWEQKVDFIICLLSDQELDKDVYWPKEKKQHLSFGNWMVSLQQIEVKDSWTQRILTLNRLEERDSRNLIHLQFTAWPGSLFPSDHIFSNFIKEVINCWKEQQRTTSQPVIVHCSSGIGRSGVFCLLATAVVEFLNKPTAIPDLLAISSNITSTRKNILRNREHLKFAFQVFLNYLHDIKLTCFHKSMDDEREKEPSLDKLPENEDPLSSLDPHWVTKRK